MAMPLSQTFFDRPVLRVAPELLGKVLVRRRGGKCIAAIITEVEAYDGPEDKASHAHRGRTTRNAPMFGPAGHWYVYLVYGMHWMLNMVTGPVGYPAAVLLRGVVAYCHPEPCVIPSVVEGHVIGLWNGPGKLTRALHVDRTFNAKPATEAAGLWIEDRGIIVPRAAVQRAPRISVDYAGAWAKKPYRFILL